jgi:hypothetical protein
MFIAVAGKEKLYVEAPAQARKVLDILELSHKKTEGGFYIEIPQHIIQNNQLHEFANILQRTIEAYIERERAENEAWFDFAEHPVVTRKDVREIIQELTDEQLWLIREWIEEEVKNRQTSLSK